MSRYARSRRIGNVAGRGGAAGCALAVAALACPALATDIIGIMPAALDQPRINATVRYPASADPLYADIYGSQAFNIQAFFDTGASGVLISKNTAGMLGTLQNPGVNRLTYNGQNVYFEDVGVAGADRFGVSVNLSISVAPYTPATEEQVAVAEEQLSYNVSTSQPPFSGVDLSYYNHSFTPVRAQVGGIDSTDPTDPNDNPTTSFSDDLDVFGMPLMKGKVVVMNPRPVENFISGNIENGVTMNTHVYDPGTPFRKQSLLTDPGIPNTARSVKLSYASFKDFTRTGTAETPTGPLTPIPPGAVDQYMPTLEHNPFIGPNPVSPAGDTTPPIKIAFNNRSTTGSFLLDTGAAASMISTQLAANLAVRYVPGTEGTDDPRLETFDPANPSAPGTPIAADNQFALSIGGIGGTKKVAGFFLSSLLVRTQQGSVANDADPMHFRFMEAPVLVTDISTQNPTTGQTLTLDGIFGMNLLVASVYVSEQPGNPFPALGAITPGAFDWAVFDEPNGLLKLQPRIPGDANGDSVVDFADLLVVAQMYDGQGAGYEQGDFNGDGMVDFADLLAIVQRYDRTDLLPGDVIDLPHYDLALGAATVPEPAGPALLAAVAAAALVRRRRRR